MTDLKKPMDAPHNHWRSDELLRAGILIVAMLIGYFIGRTSAMPPVIGNAPPAAGVARTVVTDPLGETLSLPGIDWSKSNRTLILALQTGCHFCTESGPFYQKLVRERGHFGSTNLVAVLPQSVDASKEYLKKLGVPVDEVFQGSLRGIGVSGTPTLLLVNSSGVVTEAWTGKLDSSTEREVLVRLRIIQ